MSKVPVIAVCGPVGSGKSTVVRGLAAELGFRGWPERVDQNPFFVRYMRDTSAWALRSQLAFMLLAVEDAANARREPPGGVLERPVQEMFDVFVRDLHSTGALDDDELLTLGRIVGLAERLAGVPDLLVMLHADPSHLIERIQARARPGEDVYDIQHMRRLDACYQAWRSGWDLSPVIDVDTTIRDIRHAHEIDRIADDARHALDLAP